MAAEIECEERELTDQLLTTDEAAQRLSVTPNHLEKMRVNGGGPDFVKMGRTVRYEPAALQNWIATCRRRSTSQTAAEAR